MRYENEDVPMIGFYDYTVLATYAATALGVTGMFQAVERRHLTAVFCLLAAGLLDCFDGRIARTKKDRSRRQQSFGIQIDSLNDVLCFGALPSVVFFPAFNGAVVLLSAVAGAVFYRERFSKKQVAGVFAGVAAILLLSGIFS